jgi:hypothetical protein
MSPIINKGTILISYKHKQRTSFIRGENKEFAFTKLMTCGLCGSGITADEKFKNQKNGNVHRYVYYGCTKVRDKNCKCGYIEEKELINQFQGLLDKINLNESEIKNKLNEEAERFKKFQKILSGSKEKIIVEDVDVRNYAKYILQEGSVAEKRDLLGSLRTKIIYKQKQLILGND